MLLRRIPFCLRLSLTLLVVVMLSFLIVGLIGYQSGKSSLSHAIQQHLQSLRDTKVGEVTTYIQNIRNHICTENQSRMTVDALRQFNDSFENAHEVFPDEAENMALLEQSYEANYRRHLKKIKLPIDKPIHKLPADPVARALQRVYLPTSEVENSNKLTDKKFERTSYHQTHQLFHPIFNNISEVYNYEDIFLVDAESGNIVYSLAKDIDFATNLNHGPYAATILGDVYRKAMKFKDPSQSVMSDFAHYAPSGGVPASFMASPIIDEGRTIGVLIFQLDVANLNQILTANFDWNQYGLGNSGEVYMVGNDRLMRTDSRFPIEDRKRIIKKLRDANADALNIHLMESKPHETSILKQMVSTKSVDQGLAGERGTEIIKDYRGIKVLSSFAPMNLPDLNWVLIAEIDTSEAFASITDFRDKLLISLFLMCIPIAILVRVVSHQFMDSISMIF